MSHMVELDRVSKHFGDTPVLDGMSLAVEPAEKVAIIGPSGSGKTTILRILMTLEPIDGGYVYVDGEPLWHKRVNGSLVPADEKHLHAMRHKIGMVFQHFNLFPHMSVLRNITLAPTLARQMPRDDAEQLAYRLLDMVGLRDRAESKPAELSGGQKQRVGIARALALEPKVMLFDEITSALDPELVEEVLNAMRMLGEQTDMTMLLVTHEMSFARDFADRVLFIDNGDIVEQGPPEKIFTAPQEERTQHFLRKILAAGHTI